MYFWTVQHKDVVDILLKNKSYYPDFNYSVNTAAGADMRALYPFLLKYYNKLNNGSFEGLLFGFNLHKLDDVYDLYNYLTSNPTVSLAFKFWSSDYCILKIKIDKPYNLLPIDFNDFIKLDIWLTKDSYRIKALGLNESEINRLLNNLSNGVIQPKHPSFTQIHLPYVDINNIEGVYPIINYKTGVKLDLSESAKNLKTILNLP